MINKLLTRNNIIIISAAFFLSIPFNIIGLYSLNLKFFSDLIMTLGAVILTILIFSFNRYVLKIYISALFFLNSFFFYMFFYLGIDINLNIILSILQTNKNEAIEQIDLITWYTALYSLTAIIPILLVLKLSVKREALREFIFNKTSLILLSLFLTITSLLIYPKKIFTDYDAAGIKKIASILNMNMTFFPSNYIYNSIKYATLLSNSFTHSNYINEYKFTLNKNKPFDVVLVIGETARSDRFSLNGYKRKTNPLLEKRKNLVYFSNFYSCYTGTIPSVSCLLSFEVGQDFREDLEKALKNNISSFIPIFKKLDFETYMISSSGYRPQDPIFQRVKDIEDITYITYSLGYKDEDINDVLAKIVNKPSKKNRLIIIHTMGSHYKYASRYTKEFEKWQPICSTLNNRNVKDCNIKYLNNEYDNTILYTDYVLNTFMNTLNKRESILIYTSDHGESLGEIYKGKQKFLHGGNYATVPRNEIHVPAILWFSDAWIKSFGENQIKNARNKKNAIMNHDFISHSIVDCAFIKSNFISKKLSLCSSSSPKQIIIR